MRRIKIVMLFFLSTYGLFAQVSFNNPDEGGAVSFRTTDTRTYENEEDVAEGSQYWNDEFENGEVYINDKLELRGELRFNAYKSEINVKENKYEFYSLLKRPYIHVKINNEVYKMQNYLDDEGSNRVAYFKILNENSAVKLLFKPEIILKRGRTATTNYDRTSKPRYIRLPSYYIMKGDNPAEKTYLGKRNILKVLGGNKDVYKVFIKENDLNMRDEEDVIRLLEYSATL
ncbi:hypothetical protein [Maribacter sp. R77961]|uniref:hypothetical protein n=1 Tax=Maribacter sp. R77961 TaxID=3093871 RepID=UPI0037C7E446